MQLSFEFYVIEAKPENLIGDRPYNSDELDEVLREQGVVMIAQHRSNRRKPPTQDGRSLRRYRRRWIVERTFAWISRCRRLTRDFERYARTTIAFIRLAMIRIMLRRLVVNPSS